MLVKWFVWGDWIVKFPSNFLIALCYVKSEPIAAVETKVHNKLNGLKAEITVRLEISISW